MFHMPMSSPMMKRMLGFLPAAPELGVGESCACAAVTMNATHRATAHCFSIFGFGFIFLLFFLCPWVVEGIVEFGEYKSFAGLAGFTYGTLAQYVRVAERTPNE